MEYGVRFSDGSVLHPWNGATQRRRATERIAYMRKEYPGDTFVLVCRSARDAPWQNAER
jgi:hypothetical protein